ncbi:MAG: hypothetical protein HYZ13_04120 [Acidobacteria bacterium]|nr:hypothetical protein [Acidobacteriota bacterium]
MADPKPIPGLRVRSVPASFWRAGRKWTKEPQEVPASAFSKAQIALLRAEPNLVVEDVELAAKAEPGAEG